jgi:hypothetical protein
MILVLSKAARDMFSRRPKSAQVVVVNPCNLIIIIIIIIIISKAVPVTGRGGP